MKSSPFLNTLTSGDYWGKSGGYNSPTPGSRLIQVLSDVLILLITLLYIKHCGIDLQYGMGWLPGRVRNNTIIYNNFLKDGTPKVIDLILSHWLKKQGKSINKI